MKKNTKQIIGIIFLLILVALIVYLTDQRRKAKEEASQPGREERNTYQDSGGNTVTEFKTEEKLPGFPESIVIPGNAVVTKNTTYTSPTGRVQATKVFEVSTPIEEVFSFYKGFIKGRSDFKLISEVNEPKNTSHKALFAENSEGIININLNGDQTKTVVDLSFTYNK